MKPKKFLVPFLLVLTLVIWSHNIYKIIVGVSQSGEDEADLLFIQKQDTLTHLSSAEFEEKEPFVYRASYRDPFQHWLYPPKKATAPAKTVPKKARKVEEDLPPKLRFSGLVQDEAGPLAIIEAPDGQTYFAKEKDIVAKVTIVKITPDSILYSYKEKPYCMYLRE